MKVAFVSDTHFGYPRFEADATVQGIEAILDAAKKADVLVLGGDIFDHRIPKLETILEVAKCLQDAKKIMDAKDGRGTKDDADAHQFILGIHGTHERRAKDALNPISMLAQMGLMEDLHNRTVVVGKKSETGTLEHCAFSGMGGLPDDLVGEALGRLACKPVEGAVNFFIFHQTMKEFVPVPLDELASVEDLPKGYDYYLCGHIHAKRELMNGRLLLSGSTVMTQMKDEEMGEKGYYIIDTAKRASEFVPIATRPFFVSELKFDGAKPSQVRAVVEKEIMRLLEQKYRDKPILKIKLTGNMTDGAGELDLSGLEKSEQAFISIDNQMDGANLAGELAQLREERMNRATPLELGMAILREQAVAAGIKAERAQELFEKYTKEE